MKKRIIFGLSLAGLLVFSSAILPELGKENNKVAEGYSTSSLPTTIDLNDTSEANIRNYYSSLNNLATNQRQGNNLLKNLKTILKTGQKYYSYDSGNAIWQIYEITDRDWDKSPASSTSYGTYNSSTNKITNYTYGTSTSEKKNNPYIHALYINRNVTNQTRAWDDHQQTQWGINREHVWPKAEGFETSGAGGARGDPMHLMAGNGYANNIHSNYYYGYVKTSSSYTDCGSKYSNQSGNLRGTSKTLNTGTVFEPQDCDKGDIARAIFYMVARYNYLSGSDSDGIDSNNPNLALTQSLSDWASSGYSSTTSKQGKMGIMTDLLAWHHADPVDEYEIHRNNLLYTNYTNNRNPFIDFPEWADFIWGSVNYSGSTYISNDTTPTGYATPSTDTINGYNEAGDVSVTGVTLDVNSQTISVGSTYQLNATVVPSNATNKNVSWTSSNNNVASVSSNGLVTANATGNAIITVTTEDGSKTATCNITVQSGSIAVSSVSLDESELELETGDNVTLTATVLPSNATDKSVTWSTSDDSVVTVSNGNVTAVGAGTATITVTTVSGSKTATCEVTVTSSGGDSGEETESGSISAASGALEGWTADGTGTAYADGSVKFDSGGDNVFKTDIFSGDVSSNMTSLTVTVNGKINGTPTAANSYKVEALDSSGNVLYSDTKTGSDVVTTSYGNTTFALDYNLSGCTGIKITYVTKGGGNWGVKSVSWTATYSTEATITSIAVKTAPTKTTYNVGDDFAPAGLVIAATYSDSTTADFAYSDDPDAFDFEPFDNLQTTDTNVTITFAGVTCSQEITVNAVVTSISATANKTFIVGDTISKSDITVKDNLGNTITDYTFANNNYQFTYSDAVSGGDLTTKTFLDSITYSTFTCSLDVRVARKARHSTVIVSDTLNLEFTGQSGSKYGSWSDNEAPDSDAVYAGNNAGSHSSIQLRTENSNSGIVSTTSGGFISKVVVVWNTNTTNGRTLNIYGNNTAYSSPSELYGSDKGTLLGTIVKGTSTILVINREYAYVGVRSNSGAMYLDSITFTYGTEDSATNLSNYIMYEDTNNQCSTKTSIAEGYFEGLSKEERNTFMNSTDYVIATARERFEAWLRHEGKSISYTDNDYVVSKNRYFDILAINIAEEPDTMLVVIIALSLMTTLGLFVIYKKKRGH